MLAPMQHCGQMQRNQQAAPFMQESAEKHLCAGGRWQGKDDHDLFASVRALPVSICPLFKSPSHNIGDCPEGKISLKLPINYKLFLNVLII